MRCVLFITCWIAYLSSAGFAQPILLPDKPCKNLLSLSGGLCAEGWGIDVNRGWRFYQRGFLDSTFLSETLKLMSPNARFGIENSQQIQWGWSPDSTWKSRSIQMGAEIRNTSASSGSFSRDLFELIFLGNQNSIGRTISGDGLYLRSTTYRTWGIWASRVFTIHSHRIWLQVSLGWIQGLNYSNRSFSQLQFTTQAGASALSLAVSGEQNFLQDRNKAFFGVNGNGASLSGNLKWETPSNYKIVVHWEDFGWVNWRKVSSEQWDTVVRFTGFTIDPSTLINKGPRWNTDSIWQVSKGVETKSQNIMLPFLWAISVEKKLPGSRWGVFSSARQRLGYQQLPWIQAGIGYNQGMNRLETSIGGGGQGGLGWLARWVHQEKHLDVHCTLQLPLNGLGTYAMGGLQAGASILYRFSD